MHVEPGTQEALIAYLESMKFFYRVEVADRTEEFAVVHLPAGSIADGPGRRRRCARRRTAATCSCRAPTWRPSPPQHGPAIGLLAYEALRVEAHRPRLGLETDHRTIPHELGWIGTAVHLQKGCYRGQETVARVHNLGKPPRRLVFLHLDGSEVQLPGARRPGPARRPTARRAASSASSPPRPATTSWARSRSPWSSGTCRWTPTLHRRDTTAAAQEVVVAP